MRPSSPKLTTFATLPPVKVGIGGADGPVGVLVADSVESVGCTVVVVPLPEEVVLPPVGIVVKPELVGQAVESVLRHSVTVTVVSVSVSVLLKVEEVVEVLGGGRVGVEVGSSVVEVGGGGGGE